MNATETLNDTESKILEGLSGLHTQVIDANKAAFERLTDLREQGPELSEMPSPAEGVRRYFEFAGKIFDANREFAEQMVSVWAPAEKTPAETAK
jgi:hypothetical protein